MPLLVWAIRIRYLSNTDGKWHSHTTKWHCDSDDAWKEAEDFQKYYHAIIAESSCSLIHRQRSVKEIK